MKTVVALIFACAALGYVATGVYFVQPDERAVVMRFGRALPTTSEPGAHFGLPWGLDQVVRLKVREVRRVTIGPPNLAQNSVGRADLQLLTGDRNLVNVQATVQYTIKQPTLFLFRSKAVGPMLATAGEAALAEILARKSVDWALTDGKRELGFELNRRVQLLADDYELGISVRSVDLGHVQAPAEVADAFERVLSALRQREQSVNEARSFENRVRAQATGDAQAIRDRAKTYRDRAVLRALGEASRFESLLTEYLDAPELTSRRLYLKTMAEVLPRFRAKVIVAPESGVDISIFGEESR